MNNKLKVGLLTAASSIALGAFLGITAQKAPVEAKATGVSGTISVDLTGENWATNIEGQNISVYFWDSENESNTGWGSYEIAEQNEYVVFVDYDLGFTPTNMKAVRYDPWFTETAWESDRWGQNQDNWSPKWNESDDLDFTANGNIVIAGTGYCFVGYPYIEGKCSENSWSWGTIADLSNVKLNDSKHAEYYLDVTFTQWYEFGVKIFSNFYTYDACTFSSYINNETYAWTSNGDGKNIQYTSSTSVLGRLYFDRNAGTIYINTAVNADADEWAQEFLGGSCADSKNNWSSSSASYYAYSAKYGSDFTDLFTEPDHVDYDAEVEGYVNLTLQRYDYVLNLYGVYDETSNPNGYSDFLGRAGTKFTVSGKTTWGINAMNSDNVPAIVIASISAIGIATVAGFFLLKKRKEN